jgi:tRNA-2-methylthio-N6-dimethylallyladenosine synthase
MNRFHVITFGCQMNAHDSDRIAEVLMMAGYCAAGAVETADVVILNTCSVRDKAEQKLRSEVGRLGIRKAQGLLKTIVVAGCVGQQEGRSLLRAAPEINLVIGPDNIAELPALLEELNLGGLPKAVTRFDETEPRFLPIRTNLSGVSAATFVTVMKGCNERCSFCIVPYTRGQERYRASAEIIEEIGELVSKGTSEVTLLGQTVNSYRDPTHALTQLAAVDREIWDQTSRQEATTDNSEFPALLRAIAARIPNLRRLRYMSPHPRHLTRALIAAHRELPVLCRHVHLPVQSGSNRVLRRMIRRYTVEEFVERAESLRHALPGLTLSTDIIVGFPGESRQDFEATLSLVKRMKFVGLFGFKYSERPGTPALRLTDDIDENEKSARLTTLFAISDAQRQSHLASLVGTRQSVLVERQAPDGAWTGRTERNEIVHFACRENVEGRIIDVTIRQAFKNSLAAEAISPKLQVPMSGLARLNRRVGTENGSPTAEPGAAPKSNEKRLLKVV